MKAFIKRHREAVRLQQTKLLVLSQLSPRLKFDIERTESASSQRSAVNSQKQRVAGSDASIRSSRLERERESTKTIERKRLLAQLANAKKSRFVRSAPCAAELVLRSALHLVHTIDNLNPTSRALTGLNLGTSSLNAARLGARNSVIPLLCSQPKLANIAKNTLTNCSTDSTGKQRNRLFARRA